MSRSLSHIKQCLRVTPNQFLPEIHMLKKFIRDLALKLYASAKVSWKRHMLYINMILYQWKIIENLNILSPRTSDPLLYIIYNWHSSPIVLIWTVNIRNIHCVNITYYISNVMSRNSATHGGLSPSHWHHQQLYFMISFVCISGHTIMPDVSKNIVLPTIVDS